MPRRIDGFAAGLLGVSSTLLVLTGGNLLFAAWLFATIQHKPFWALFWTAFGAGFVAYGVVSLLGVARAIAAPAMLLIRPLLRLGALALVLAGAAWPIQVEMRWRRTGEFEGYGVAMGLIMVLQGVAVFMWLAGQRRRATGA